VYEYKISKIGTKNVHICLVIIKLILNYEPNLIIKVEIGKVASELAWGIYNAERPRDLFELYRA